MRQRRRLTRVGGEKSLLEALLYILQEMVGVGEDDILWAKQALRPALNNMDVDELQLERDAHSNIITFERHAFFSLCAIDDWVSA